MKTSAGDLLRWVRDSVWNVFLPACLLGGWAASGTAGPDTPDFNRDVRPILVANCLSCHGMDEAARQAGLRLDDAAAATTALASGGRAIVPGDPEQSGVLSRVCSADGDEVMPPPPARRLTKAEIDVLRRWIAAGALYARHWSHQPPARREPPAVTDGRWPKTPVDRFILRDLEARGLTPAEEADRRTLARRLFLDLTGLPPSPAELQSFLDDFAPDAYERLVDRLLASPQYGERWARFWLDLVRYADSAGYEGDPEYPQAWRYRDYVIDAFNSDKPFDRFVLEQLAGDELEPIRGAGEPPLPSAEGVVAVTFLRLAPFTEPRGDETRELMLSEMTDAVGSVFLAQTIGCAKCHDHKYDQISSRDFYRLKAFFATIQIAPPKRGDAFQIGGSQPAEFYRPGEKDWVAAERGRLEACMGDLVARRDALETELRRAVATARGAGDLVDVATLRTVASDRVDPALSPAQRTSWENACRDVVVAQLRLERLAPAAMSLRHTFGPPYEPGAPTTHVLLRGDFTRPGPVVQPGFPTAIVGHDRPAVIPLDPFRRWPTRGWRKALAEWIASPENPLTSRVIVNRIWQHHFGRGIVATPNDFGALGSPPSHPELLDWLAVRFIEERWSIKAIQRLIVTSATYRQSSQRIDARAEAVDPANDLLWRYRRWRLDAEAIRDGILAASGALAVDRVGGLTVFPPLPVELTAEAQEHNRFRWQSGDPADVTRRSIYVFQQRSMHLPLLEVFDGRVPDSSCAQREATVNPLQALALLNGDLVVSESSRLASRIRREVGGDADAAARSAFQFVLCRAPDDAELGRIRAFLADEQDVDPLVSLCRVLFNSNEFIHVD